MTTRAKPKWYLRGAFLAVAIPVLLILALGAAWWFAPIPMPPGAVAVIPGTEIDQLVYSPDGSQALLVIRRPSLRKLAPSADWKDRIRFLLTCLRDWRDSKRAPALRGLARGWQRLALWRDKHFVVGPIVPSGMAGWWFWKRDNGLVRNWMPDQLLTFDTRTLTLTAAPLPFATPQAVTMRLGVESPNGEYVAYPVTHPATGNSTTAGVLIFRQDGMLVRSFFHGLAWARPPAWRSDDGGLVALFEEAQKVGSTVVPGGAFAAYWVPTDPASRIRKVTGYREAGDVRRTSAATSAAHFAMTFDPPWGPAMFMLGEGDPPDFVGMKEMPRGSSDPQWSPRGDWIAFFQSQTGTGAEALGKKSQVLLIRPDGSGMHSVHEGSFPGELIRVAWHPSGEKIIAARGGALFEVAVPPAPSGN